MASATHRAPPSWNADKPSYTNDEPEVIHGHTGGEHMVRADLKLINIHNLQSIFIVYTDSPLIKTNKAPLY